MNTTKLILATLAGTVISWLIGGLFYLLLLKSYFAANVGDDAAVKAEPDMLPIILGCFFISLLITYIFMKWANISTFMTGLSAGGTIGLMAGLAFNMWRLGDSHYFGSMIPAIVDAVVMGVMGACTGAVIGWILGRE